MVAGLASTVGMAQALLLKATYESPPDARGPRQGVERPVGLRPPFAGPGPATFTLSASQGHVTRIATAEAAAEAVAAAEAAQIAAAQAAAASDLHVRAPERKILVIGDSLVSGVGGAASFKNSSPDGPALPRHVARKLSELLDTDVHWNALSLTGGDVRMLRKKVIPMLKRERERVPADQNLFSAVVLVTGFNDMKRVSPVRTAKKFRDDLSVFIDLIREQVGADCDIFLPSIPGVHHTPRFHEPLRSILIFLNNLWDAQKIALSRRMSNVHFVGNPPEAAWNPNPRVFFSSLDRIHPSELGYKHWGYRIANDISKAFRKSVQLGKISANKITEGVSDAVTRVGQVASEAVANGSAVAATVGNANNAAEVPLATGNQ